MAGSDRMSESGSDWHQRIIGPVTQHQKVPGLGKEPCQPLVHVTE